MKNFKQIKQELLSDKQTKKVYDQLEPEFAIVRALIGKRVAKGVTQAELAKLIGSKQSAISRLESGAYNPTLGLLNKVSKALGAKLKVTIQ